MHTLSQVHGSLALGVWYAEPSTQGRVGQMLPEDLCVVVGWLVGVGWALVVE